MSKDDHKLYEVIRAESITALNANRSGDAAVETVVVEHSDVALKGAMATIAKLEKEIERLGGGDDEGIGGNRTKEKKKDKKASFAPLSKTIFQLKAHRRASWASVWHNTDADAGGGGGGAGTRSSNKKVHDQRSASLAVVAGGSGVFAARSLQTGE